MIDHERTSPLEPAGSVSRRRFLKLLGLGSASLALSTYPSRIALAGNKIDSNLELEIERYIRDLRSRSRIPRDEETSWSVFDLTTERKLVSINEDVPRQAASMIKPFVALAFFYKATEDPKRYRYDSRIKARMQRMIQRSSNSETNYLMNLLSKRGRGRGPREVEHILKAYSPGVFKQTKIVELIPSGGKSYKNLASAHDYSRFLYALWHDNFPYTSELRRLMSLPNNDRIFKGARRIPHRTDVYDKTGTTARLCGNMGILVARGRNGRRYPYTLIGIIEKKKRTRSLTRWINSRGDVIREVSNKVYLHMRSTHNLA